MASPPDLSFALNQRIQVITPIPQRYHSSEQGSGSSIFSTHDLPESQLRQVIAYIVDTLPQERILHLDSVMLDSCGHVLKDQLEFLEEVEYMDELLTPLANSLFGILILLERHRTRVIFSVEPGKEAMCFSQEGLDRLAKAFHRFDGEKHVGVDISKDEFCRLLGFVPMEIRRRSVA
ncbi:hypothetical protein BKA67DRAFT_537127 [Truncatella angustata]|uniref:Uncharacterized protein n=1 Tax=Truncatella angustata TaxID=152316 RepID=A0A9P8UJV9_9PEZI|nr:uncharacterized protein BKA67DRAFT_537127 [Truncatella angustata]KAH6653451.1 hypothetical protein BKA67DRAFT_537127 [Truncatella angustata]